MQPGAELDRPKESLKVQVGVPFKIKPNLEKSETIDLMIEGIDDEVREGGIMVDRELEFIYDLGDVSCPAGNFNVSFEQSEEGVARATPDTVPISIEATINELSDHPTAKIQFEMIVYGERHIGHNSKAGNFKYLDVVSWYRPGQAASKLSLFPQSKDLFDHIDFLISKKTPDEPA